MTRSPRHAFTLLDILAAEAGWLHGYSLMKATGLASGTLYPLLIRLADEGLVEPRWQEPVKGRPPRHAYRITVAGLRRLAEARAGRGRSSAAPAGDAA